mgnify:CR=1 FL=1
MKPKNPNNRIISLRREELKRDGHKLLDLLSKKYTEQKVRASVSGRMGLKYRKNNKNSGFHFGHDQSIKDLEKAVEWMKEMKAQDVLTPRLKELKEKEERLPDIKLSQTKMKKAFAELKRRKRPWYKKVLDYFL